MSIQQDVHFALRSWRRTPGLIAVASLSLAVGIGATSSMFSVINAVSQHELAFEDPERLVVLWHSNPERGFQRQVPSYETTLPLLEQSQSFQGIGFFQAGGAPVTLAGMGPATRVSNQPIDVNIFSVLGVPPLLGRGYRQDDLANVIKQKEVEPIVISYDTWQSRLDGDPDIIGKAIRIDAATRTVIGVMPQGFTIVPWVEEVAFWAANDLSRVPEARWMIAIGRLKPGVTTEQAEAEATAVTRRVLEARGEENPSAWSARIDTLHEAYFGGVQSGLTFLLGAVSFVLLIACANVANLLLVSGAARQKELALRASLGARRIRLLRQLLTESVVLALVGGLLGIVFAFWCNRVFAALVPEDLPGLFREVSIDLRVLGFVLVVSVATGILFGLVPALRASKVDLNDALKEGGRGSLALPGRGRAALLVAEVALSMILLVGAGLMMRGFLKERNALPGFDTEKLLTADILLGGTKYFEKIPGDKNRVTPECAAFFERVLEGVRALPGVRSASIISRLPLEQWTHPFTIVGRPRPEPGNEPNADFNEVDAELLKTLEIPLLKGRHIDGGDVESGPWVAVINKTFAERHFPDEDPIGQAIHVTFGGGGSGIRIPEPQPREIVGVVANVEYPSFFEQKPAALYVPHRQHPEEYSGGDQWMHIRKTLLIRTSVNPLSVVSQVEKVIEGVDSNQAAHGFMTMEQRVGSSPSVTQGRFLAQLFAIFGGLAIMLALVGVYGVMSCSVGQRTGEFGVRMALGARGTDLVVMLLRQSLKTILVGVALGLAGGLALSSLLNSVFWRLTTLDPVAFGAVTALMVGAALLSAYGAVHGVTRIDPQQALRYE